MSWLSRQYPGHAAYGFVDKSPFETELTKRREKKRSDALGKMRRIAEEIEMIPDELLGLPPAGDRRRRGGGRGPIAWQHPDDPGKVYRGRKKPDWLNELKAEGRDPKKVG